jgi:uncharacterized protein YfbU (UPF0304 family)
VEGENWRKRGEQEIGQGRRPEMERGRELSNLKHNNCQPAIDGLYNKEIMRTSWGCFEASDGRKRRRGIRDGYDCKRKEVNLGSSF